MFSALQRVGRRDLRSRTSAKEREGGREAGEGATACLRRLRCAEPEDVRSWFLLEWLAGASDNESK